MTRDFVILESAIKAGRSAGITGDVRGRLNEMAIKSVPTKSPFGNRRFNQWVMRVVDGAIENVTLVPSLGRSKPQSDWWSKQVETIITEELGITKSDCTDFCRLGTPTPDSECKFCRLVWFANRIAKLNSRDNIVYVHSRNGR